MLRVRSFSTLPELKLARVGSSNSSINNGKFFFIVFSTVKSDGSTNKFYKDVQVAQVCDYNVSKYINIPDMPENTTSSPYIILLVCVRMFDYV